MKNLTSFFTVIVFVFISITGFAQRNKNNQAEDAANLLNDSIFSAFKLRNIGPAFMSGRIADIAIHPKDDNLWYVAVGSGGVWKTKNSGVTWESLFDGQGSYSIGCLTIDSNNPNVIWVGTGENVGGRHVGYGDGIYKSEDGGKSWENMGLKESEHISKIIIHPDNPDVLWVAAQGPLWSAGGERGLFKTIDGGKSWEKQLGDDEYTGVTDILIDPRNPDVLYAATWQHHRTVAAYMGGGPKTAIYRTDDGGENWQKLDKGLPAGNMGKIGLAISPQNPDVVYAAIELDRRSGGVYRTSDRGASWKKMSNAVSGGTGPHYYQELYASPHKFDRIYLADVRMQVSDDGGETFRQMKETFKHSDNHALAFRKNDPDYLLVGTDGGIYESFDLEENWRFIDNLPLTQFYKVAVDDKKPFYYVYGGTQDNNTQGGPSRTDNLSGIRNSDWEVILFADGHQPATEPGNPDIMYAEWQQGNLVRVDRRTGEIIHIQPQPEKGESVERFNWDAPILVSPHNPTTLFFASQRVWKSDNRGDSWTPISEDLTRNQERITLSIMGKQQSWDSPWDFFAMSNYNTITSLSESPVKKGIIYAGTDDGIIQITENGGESWRKIEVGSIQGVPEMAFVNDIKADLFDENTVYAVLDNHKYGDFQPYLVKSTDKGKTWKSIVSNLPDRSLLWRIVQDHINPDLLFLGTEFGIYFTVDGGEKWVKLTGDAPTISFRDLAIQRRENDLIGASFGRGFFILDDYAPLRTVTSEKLNSEAALFPVRDAWWYIPREVLGDSKKGSQGEGLFVADNPPFGAVFTFYLKDDIKTLEEIRKEKEKKLENEIDVPFPGWKELDKEKHQQKPALWLTVSDTEGTVIRKLKAPAKKGFHRIAWDLHYASIQPITESNGSNDEKGILAAPGQYFVTLSKEEDGKVIQLAGRESFNVVPLREGSLQGSPHNETVKFRQELSKMQRAVQAFSLTLNKTMQRVNLMETSLKRAAFKPGELNQQLYYIKMKLVEIDTQLNGSSSKNEVGEKNPPSVKTRINAASMGTENSTYGPTPTHQRSLEIAQEEFSELRSELKNITVQEIPILLKKLFDAGAPWLDGMPIPEE